MEMYGYTAPEFYGIDDLLDLSNDHIFSSSSDPTTTTATAHHNSSVDHTFTTTSSAAMHFNSASDFTADLCVPNDDVAELEWLSNFVDDSNSNFPASDFAGTMNSRGAETAFHGRSRSKRSRAPAAITNTWTSIPQSHVPMHTNYNNNNNNYNNNSPISSSESSDTRRCSHCASEKTPQWRTGPLGPKTLCNACGVRYKSGRLVPEYRPAASPTFVLTQHSNSHRKVMELRRQKEEQQGHGHHHHRNRNYEVC